jgi:hypothetical protein
LLLAAVAVENPQAILTQMVVVEQVVFATKRVDQLLQA